MLSFDQIKEYFSSDLVKLNPKGVLVEYLQYEFLDSLFKQVGSENLSFIGGTAVRIIYNSKRFSEDLDFDNSGLSYRAFKKLMAKVCSEMQVKGFELEVRFLKKGKAFHCYVRFPKILFQLGISPHRNEKIFLSVDAERKKKLFDPEMKTLNKFGVFRNILVNPAPILLSQKLLAILFRKREKGRDFYDASFLGGMVKPDFDYIKRLKNIDKDEFTQKLKKRCAKLNYKALARDVELFLFKTEEADRILLFRENLDNICC